MVKYPEMRAELIEYLSGLKDLNYQKECWIKRNCPKDVAWDDFDQPVHFLFDDTELATDPNSYIGIILIDQKEAALVQQLCKEIDLIFDKYGTKLSDQQYIDLPEWIRVLEAAQAAYGYIAN